MCCSVTYLEYVMIALVQSLLYKNYHLPPAATLVVSYSVLLLLAMAADAKDLEYKHLCNLKRSCSFIVCSGNTYTLETCSYLQAIHLLGFGDSGRETQEVV